MTRLVNETRLLLVPGVNSDIYGMLTPIIINSYGENSKKAYWETKRYVCDI